MKGAPNEAHNRSYRFIELVDLALFELALGVEAKTDMPSSLAGWAMSGCKCVASHDGTI